MLRSVLAVVAGFLVPAVLVTLTDQLMAVLVPDLYPQPAPGVQIPPAGLALNVTYGFVYAILGGWVTARLAPRLPMKHVYALCAAIAVFGLVSALMLAGMLPLWYSLALVALGILGAVLGGRLFVRRTTQAEATTPGLSERNG
jgi:hypothetical protein